MENSILNVTVSYYNHYSGKNPIERNLLSYLSDYSLENYVAEIRSKTTKAERDELKAKLPGITPSAICYPTRNEQNVVTRTGLISFDIDKIPAEKLDLFYSIITNMPYVAYCGLSVSGSGYWGLVPISNPAKFNQHFDALQLYFKSLGIDRPYFDIAVKDIARFRYYSVDRNAYFNHSAEVFNYTYEVPVKSKKPYEPKAVGSTDLNPFDAFNQSGDVESLLIAYGWTYQPKHDKGTRHRYARPGKERGISADYCTERKLLYLFSDDAATGLELPNKAYNNVSVYCQLECGGDIKLCGRKLRALGYGKTV